MKLITLVTAIAVWALTAPGLICRPKKLEKSSEVEQKEQKEKLVRTYREFRKKQASRLSIMKKKLLKEKSKSINKRLETGRS